MARIKHGILGNLQGNISFLNGYSNYSKSIIRRKQFSRTNPNTPAQLVNRDVFKQVAIFQNQIYSGYISLLLKLTPGLATPYFKFNKLNQHLFDANGLVDHASLVQSNGSHLGLDNFRITAFASNNYIRVEWNDNSDGVLGFSNDILYCFAYNITDRLIQLPTVFPVRSDGVFDLPVVSGWSTRDSVIVYGSFVKYNLLSVSRTSSTDI